jgi:aspartate kinase
MARKIEEYKLQGYTVIIVVSAIGKTTNHLYSITKYCNTSYTEVYKTHKKMCNDLNIDFSKIEILLEQLMTDINDLKYSHFKDIAQQKIKIISMGEILSSTIAYIFLKSVIHVDYLNAHLFIKNTNNSNDIDKHTLVSKGLFYCDTNIMNLVSSYDAYITQGFISTTYDDNYCIMTRSGSNTTASLIANTIDADRVEIYTDVYGLYSGNPKTITNAKLIENITYDVCLEASSMGANLIHPFSIKPCQDKNIPIYIKSTFEPDKQGTIISNNFSHESNSEKIYLISVQNNISIFTIYSIDMSDGFGFMADIFEVFRDQKIDVNIVITSQFEITTTTNEISTEKLRKLESILSNNYNVSVKDNCSIVSIVAENTIHNSKIDACKKHILENEIYPIWISAPSSNRLTWSYVVPTILASKLENILHTNLIEKNEDIQDLADA